jgi:hypothetical protein
MNSQSNMSASGPTAYGTLTNGVHSNDSDSIGGPDEYLEQELQSIRSGTLLYSVDISLDISYVFIYLALHSYFMGITLLLYACMHVCMYA